jgi:hypothetical protein
LRKKITTQITRSGGVHLPGYKEVEMAMKRLMSSNNSMKEGGFPTIPIHYHILFFAMRTLDNLVSRLPFRFLRKLVLLVLHLLSAIKAVWHVPPPYNLNFSREMHNCRKCLDHKNNIHNVLYFDPYKFEYDPIVECEVCGKMKWSENNSYLK